MSILNEQKNTVSVVNELKAGSAWDYDAPYLTYDGAVDPITGMPVLYNGIGTETVIYNESKNPVSVANEDKNNV